MKIRWTITLVSALLLSLCLLGCIPGSVQLALNWQEWRFSCVVIQNFTMSIGLLRFGYVVIGLIVLWTGYRKRERWAWFVMLALVLFFSFAVDVLPWIMQFHTRLQWDLWVRGLPWCAWLRTGTALGIINFLVMLIALLLPIKEFFWTKTRSE